jgi:hypothetical protein
VLQIEGVIVAERKRERKKEAERRCALGKTDPTVSDPEYVASN